MKEPDNNCPLTAHLCHFRNKGEKLREHLGRCQDCSSQWKILSVLHPPSPPPKEPCPPLEKLIEYSKGTLEEDAALNICDHLIVCIICFETIRYENIGRQGLPNLDKLLTQVES